MFQVVLQVLDFMLKAGAKFLETSEGQKEWAEIEAALQEARE